MTDTDEKKQFIDEEARDIFYTDIQSMKVELSMITPNHANHFIQNDRETRKQMKGLLENYHNLFDNVPDDDNLKKALVEFFFKYLAIDVTKEYSFDSDYESDSSSESKETDIPTSNRFDGLKIS